MLDFTFSDTLSPRIAAGRRASTDFTPALAAIADLMRTRTVERFDSQIGPDGVRWKPSQRAIEDGGLTLVKSGALRLSITADSDRDRAVAGTNLLYAAIHQFGGKIKAKAGGALRTPAGPRASVTMPARPFLGFSATDTADIEGILSAHLATAFAGGAA